MWLTTFFIRSNEFSRKVIELWSTMYEKKRLLQYLFQITFQFQSHSQRLWLQSSPSFIMNLQYVTRSCYSILIFYSVSVAGLDRTLRNKVHPILKCNITIYFMLQFHLSVLWKSFFLCWCASSYQFKSNMTVIPITALNMCSLFEIVNPIHQYRKKWKW